MTPLLDLLKPVTSTIKKGLKSSFGFTKIELKYSSNNLCIILYTRWNAVAVLHYKNIIINTCQLHAYRYFPRWRLLEHEFRTQYSARLIQMDPELWTVKFKCPQHGAKCVVKFPREGTAEVFKCRTFARNPPPPLLHLNIDTCIIVCNFPGKFLQTNV